MMSKDAENPGGDAELARGSASDVPFPDAKDPPGGAESLSILPWFSIAAVLAGACLSGEYVLGFAWFFSPGWANDPLFGPSFHAVLATAMTAWVSLLLITAAACAGALVGCVCALLGVGEKYGRRVYGGWLLFAAIVILFLSIWIYWSFYAQVLQAFPDGYHVASSANRASEVIFRGFGQPPKL